MMPPPSPVPIPYRIIALMQERNRLFEYPYENLASAIRAYGFRCSRCGRCCTRSFNNHVFLLDHDVACARELDPGSLEPAPDPEFCDQNGTFYVSGYALKMNNGESGSCWFLDEKNRCRIYDRRFAVCRIYPFMLRPVPGEGRWQRFARPEEHGEYHHPVPENEVQTLAREIREYENAFLTQQISFLETLHEYFLVMGLWHDPREYVRLMQRFQRGDPVDVMVYYAGDMEPHRVIQSGMTHHSSQPGTSCCR